MLLWLLLAQDLGAWQSLYEGLLIESAEGDTQRAIQWYEGLIAGLPEDDPSVGELSYWLARAYYTQGEAEKARQALRVALEDPTISAEARALLGQIDALELQVYRLPQLYDFSAGTGHFLHAWSYGDKGSIDSLPAPGSDDPALAWTTQVTEREDDAIELGFDPEAWTASRPGGPSQVEFIVLADQFPALLALVVEDERGQRYAMNDFIVARTDQWTRVTARVGELVPLDGSKPNARLLPHEVSRLRLLDVTSRYTAARGPNTLYVDNFEIR